MGGIDEELSVPPVLPSKIKSGLVTCKAMATTTAPSCRIAIFGIPARAIGDKFSADLAARCQRERVAEQRFLILFGYINVN